MNENGQKINLGNRLASMLIDHMAMCFVMAIVSIPFIAFAIAKETVVSRTASASQNEFLHLILPAVLLGFGIYLCKDSINGRSIGKRLIKFQVVNNNDGHIASPLKCMLRNIFIFLWPLEVIVVLINPGRRIGDFVAGTKIVNYESSNETGRPRFAEMIISLIIAVAIVYLLFLPFEKMSSKIPSEGFVESSYNRKLSKEAMQLCKDSLGQYLTPDIMIYDKSAGVDSNYKFISIIFRLKEDYIEDENNFSALKAKVSSALNTRFPGTVYHGQVQYFYRSGLTVHSSSVPYK